MLVTYIRVRPTSAREELAAFSALSIFRIAWTAWAYGSPAPTTRPSGPVAVVPDTWTHLPTRTAREYPMIGSHGVPLEMSCRWVATALPVLSSEEGRKGLSRGFSNRRGPR